jgi:hypothetical protein
MNGLIAELCAQTRQSAKYARLIRANLEDIAYGG